MRRERERCLTSGGRSTRAGFDGREGEIEKDESVKVRERDKEAKREGSGGRRTLLAGLMVSLLESGSSWQGKPLRAPRRTGKP